MPSKAAGWALLALVLVQGAAAQAPSAESPITAVPAGGFSQKLAPPIIMGIARGSMFGYPNVGLATNEAVTYIFYDANGQVFTQIANYTSWQCAPYLGPGGYISVWTGRNYAYDFSYENVTDCELGVVDRKAGNWTFVTTPVSQGCPTNISGPGAVTVTFLEPMAGDTKGFASPSEAFCGA
ncbi:hypothetical protein ABPG77_001997 [Micractinium sp. CCAP 211/92]